VQIFSRLVQDLRWWGLGALLFFITLALGVVGLGVSVADTYVEYDVATKQQTEKPLARQLELKPTYTPL